MISRQLELGLENQPGMRPVRPRRSRSNRAHWWFEKMHGAVEQARDWPPDVPSPGNSRGGVSPTAAGPPASDGQPRRPASAPQAAPGDARAAAGPYRWRFIRSRQLTWD
jgi:hypothetical protein